MYTLTTRLHGCFANTPALLVTVRFIAQSTCARLLEYRCDLRLRLQVVRFLQRPGLQRALHPSANALRAASLSGGAVKQSRQAQRTHEERDLGRVR